MKDFVESNRMKKKTRQKEFKKNKKIKVNVTNINIEYKKY